MTPDQIYVCVLVVLALGLFIWEKIPPDIVALVILALLFLVPVGGKPVLASRGPDGPADLGAVFGNPALLTVLFMFVLGAAMEMTGLIGLMGQWFEARTGGSERRVLPLLALLTVASSAFLNNTTVVVVFVPMVIGLCRRLQLAPSRYLMPLSYLGIAGGMCTLIGTSTNLVANGVATAKGLDGFSMFETTPLGLCFAAITTLYLAVGGRRLLPDRVSLAALIDEEDGREFLTAAIVPEDSAWVGCTIVDTPLAARRDLRVIEVRRAGNRVETPLNEVRFQAGDRIVLKSHLVGVLGIDVVPGLERAARSEFGLAFPKVEKATLMEGMVGPRSGFIGHSVRELNIRQHFGVLILAVHRQGVNLRQNFEDLRLEFGDTLFLEGGQDRLQELFAGRDLINLTAPKLPRRRTGRRWAAIAGMLGVVVFGSIDLVPFEWVALAAALFVIVARCVEPEEAYQSIEWRVLAMIAGTLALGAGMDRTGAAKVVVTGLAAHLGDWPPSAVLSVLLLVTVVATELLSNNAVAALFAPLAIELGRALGVDPRPFVVAVMAGASIGFAMPTGYQTHMLVYGPGGYRFRDFVRAGLPLDILLWIAGSLLIPVFWKF